MDRQQLELDYYDAFQNDYLQSFQQMNDEEHVQVMDRVDETYKLFSKYQRAREAFQQLTGK